MKFGTQTHFSQFHDQGIIPKLVEAGLDFIRDEQYWSSIELTPGVFTYPTKFTDYMAKAKAVGLDVFVTLNWGNVNYDYEGGVFTLPHTESGRDAFAKYAVNVVQQFPQIKAVEVWNEINGGTFVTGPATANKPYYYTLLLKRVFDAVKWVRPDITIVAGATASVALDFWQSMIMYGALPYFDVASFHYPYDIEADTAALRALVGKPIWVTEFTDYYATAENREVHSAQFLAQTVARMASAGIDRVSWYLEMDDASFPLSGLFSGPPNFTAHGAATAYSTAIKQLTGKVFESRRSPNHIFALQFTGMTVIWTEGDPGFVELTTNAPLLVTNTIGISEMKTPTSSGIVTLPLTRDVQYVSGTITNIQAIDLSNATNLGTLAPGTYYFTVPFRDKIRYHPRQPASGWGFRMVGGVFEGTNGDPVVGPYTILHTIVKSPTGWTEVELDMGNYRYLRYRAPNGISAYGNVAEIEFYRNGAKILGTGFGTAGSYSGNGNTFHKALDGDIETRFDGPQPDNNYVGIDTRV